MPDDPRRVLEEAASRRLACELMAKRGKWSRCTIVRVEKSGVVITTPERRFDGGEEVRVWLALDEKPYTFEASVIRAGVPVPDRSQDGLLLGFIDRWTEGTDGAAKTDERAMLELQPPNGAPISLLAAPARLSTSFGPARVHGANESSCSWKRTVAVLPRAAGTRRRPRACATRTALLLTVL
jgi:hypothetical protein